MLHIAGDDVERTFREARLNTGDRVHDIFWQPRPRHAGAQLFFRQDHEAEWLAGERRRSCGTLCACIALRSRARVPSEDTNTICLTPAAAAASIAATL